MTYGVVAQSNGAKVPEHYYQLVKNCGYLHIELGDFDGARSIIKMHIPILVDVLDHGTKEEVQEVVQMILEEIDSIEATSLS